MQRYKELCYTTYFWTKKCIQLTRFNTPSTFVKKTTTNFNIKDTESMIVDEFPH